MLRRPPAGLYGPGDERRRARYMEEVKQVRPLSFMASANGLYGDMGAGALIQYTDPSDGISKTLLVCLEGNRPPGAKLLDERMMNTIWTLLSVTFEMLEEALIPLGHDAMQRDLEFGELLENAGSAAKWLVQNASNIHTIVRILSGFPG
jgi:hypothetical protein